MDCHFNEGPCKLDCKPGVCVLLKAASLSLRNVERQRIRDMVEDLEANGVSLYKMASMIERLIGEPFQYAQAQRIRDTGRCEHFIAVIVKQLHAAHVPCETLQIVPFKPANMMRMA